MRRAGDIFASTNLGGTGLWQSQIQFRFHSVQFAWSETSERGVFVAVHGPQLEEIGSMVRRKVAIRLFIKYFEHNY